MLACLFSLFFVHGQELRLSGFDKKMVSPQALNDSLEAYLAQKFPSAIESAGLTKTDVILKGKVNGDPKEVYLAETPMDVLHGAADQYAMFAPLEVGADGRFAIRLPRMRVRNGKDFDRMSCRWTLLRKKGEGWQAISAAHYVDAVAAPEKYAPLGVIAHKKGLGGWRHGVLPNELDDLGISAVTVNIMLNGLIGLTPEADSEPIVWQGRTYYTRVGYLRGLDAQMLKAAEKKVVVSAILLVGNHARGANPVTSLMGHPDAVKEGIFAMPNVTNEEGIAFYGAVLKLLTERYCRPDGKYGRIHHWIVHNEVDAGWVWTNAGEKPAVVFFDLYQRSMRLVDLFARQMDPNSRTFITLTHHWAKSGSAQWYGSKRLTDLLVRFGEVEGDFPWAMAYHPYPQNLREPRTWDDGQATFSFETDKITPKNIEVLDAYMKQPRLLYKGKVRPIHFSENGFNSKDYSRPELEAQAAGMAYVWKKMEKLSAVEVWHYHNWIDNRSEGGLRIGLRKFPDEAGDPLDKKPIWHVYQAAGTPKEDEVFKPYLKVIGIMSWSEVIHSGSIK